ncbi:hypothetical protein M011DRAFT_516914 [Sporormia fimetaria CBS 119925]|uniref:FAD-binding domain-containing protein n=1 Tax=Sporormia fimetaria CBS 119925 TaxID=1340428 RepID=A0A6A6VMW0_9PLEO|nr:hypothetical protein M011DRAFT_516914 [Sporormia fimetaria CBS 119925]
MNLGTSGLALSQGLRRAAIECIVFEQPRPSRPRDWNFGTHWGAPFLESLIGEDLWLQIQSVQVDPYVRTEEHCALKFLQGETGETLAAIPTGRFYRLRRSKLGKLLSEGLNIRYDSRLSGFDVSGDGQSVAGHFSDNDGDSKLVVGPDRAAIDRHPYAATFVQCKFTKEKALFLRSFHPLYLAGAHPDSHVAFSGMHDVADPNDPSSWTFFGYISWPSSLEEQEKTADWTDAQRLAQQKELAKKFCDPWKSAYEWIPDGTPVWYMGFTSWDPRKEGRRWDNSGGLVTMIGDAAHPMSFQRGQGLNHSLQDASNLRDAIVMIQQGADWKEMITALEEEMTARGGKEVEDGNANSDLLHDGERVKQSPLFNRGVKQS